MDGGSPARPEMTVMGSQPGSNGPTIARRKHHLSCLAPIETNMSMSSTLKA